MKVIQYLLMVAGLLLPSVALHAAGAGDPAHMQKMVDSIMAKVEQRAEHKGSRVKPIADAMKLAIVQELIKQSGVPNPEVYQAAKSVEDALLIAAEYDHSAIAKQLFTHNPSLDVNYRASSDGKTALMVAAELGQVNFAEFLLSQKKANPDICDNEGESPLLHVLYASDDVDEGEAIALLLLKHKANPNISSHEGLHPAIFLEDIRHNLLRRMIKQADINYQDPETGETALIKAARAGKAEIVKDLLKLNADVNRTNKAGQNALAVAKENVKPLLSAKPKAEAKAFVGGVGMLPATAKPFVSSDKEGSEGDSDGEGDEPRAHGAIQAEVLALCQKVGVTELNDYNQMGSIEEALFVAAENGHLALFKALFIAHPDIGVNIKDDFGTTLLIAAAAAGQTDIVRYLLEQHADINKKNGHGDTALLVALTHNEMQDFEHIDFIPVLRLLLQSKANMSISNDEGNHPLLFADDTAIGSAITQHADIDFVDNAEHGTALMKAINNDESLVQPLLEAGAMVTDEMITAAGDSTEIVALLTDYKAKQAAKHTKKSDKKSAQRPGSGGAGVSSDYPDFDSLSVQSKNEFLSSYVQQSDVYGVNKALNAGADPFTKASDGTFVLTVARKGTKSADAEIVALLVGAQKRINDIKKTQKLDAKADKRSVPVSNLVIPKDLILEKDAPAKSKEKKHKKKKAKQTAQKRAAKQAEKDKEAKEKTASELEDRLKKATEARALLDKQKALEHDAWLAQERGRRAWVTFSTTERDVHADKVRQRKSLRAEIRRQKELEKEVAKDSELQDKDALKSENEAVLAKLKDELLKDARAIKAEQTKDKAKREIQDVIRYCASQAVDQVEQRKRDQKAESRKREIHEVIAHCAATAVEQSEQRKQKEAKPKTYEEFFEQALKEKMNDKGSEAIDVQALKQQILKQWFFSAIEKGNKDLVLFCLGKGIDINCKNFEHYASTPIIMACSNGQLAIAQLLVQNKAELLIVNGVGETPAICAAQYAARTGDARVLEWLRSLNVIDMNAQDFSRKTAFDYLMAKFSVAKKDAQTQTE